MFCNLWNGASKWSGKDHKGYDAASACTDVDPCSTFCNAWWGFWGASLLSGTGFPQSRGIWLIWHDFCRYGTGFLHIKPWNRRNCYFRKLYRQIPQSYRRSSPGNTSGYLCCFDRGSDHFPVMLRIWGGSGRRSESDLYHTSECI